MKKLFTLMVAATLAGACGQPSPPPASDAAPAPAPTGAASPAGAASAASASGGQQVTAAPATSPAGQEIPAAGAASSTSATQTATPATAVAPAPAGAPVKPPEPEYREVTVPEGTTIAVALDSAIASDTSKVEDPVHARTTKPIVIDGMQVVPARSRLSGSVTEAERSGKVKGLARIAFRFTSLTPRQGDETYTLRTRAIVREAEPTKKKDAMKIGGGAVGGAIIGGLIGGKKGAGVGTVVGGGAGTGAVMATRGEEVRIAAGEVVTIRLTEPLIVRVPVR
ncbi:MAG: hypothetical protein HYX76_00560 [Acidobacteria bacterium]|nr:hypothetical protein [Acidobacteriota bacterium]